MFAFGETSNSFQISTFHPEAVILQDNKNHMRRIKRRVIVKGVKHDIWLGLVKKGFNNATTFHVYYYTGNPDDADNKPVSLKSGIKGEKEAIQYGVDFMQSLIESIMERDKTS